jgi:hypothetical protein
MFNISQCLYYRSHTNLQPITTKIERNLENAQGVSNLHPLTYQFVEKLDPKMLVPNY